VKTITIQSAAKMGDLTFKLWSDGGASIEAVRRDSRGTTNKMYVGAFSPSDIADLMAFLLASGPFEAQSRIVIKKDV
jgi:hypothetical protein